MATMSMSPASSPRLPSPPPMAEDQLGPKSPTANLLNEQRLLGQSERLDISASRRIRPGTKTSDIPEGPPLVDMAEIDSAYQLTEHLKALYNEAIHPKDSDTIIPIDRAIAMRLSTPPKDIDRALWLYELCRFLCQKVNTIIIALFSDNPPCSAQTCSEMRASEWQYLCAVHDPPKPCCAIDYCCHTLDWAANVLTSQKHFPSRMSLGPEHGASHQQLRQLTNIFRRVYRIFAHAWFQHREVFWKVETKTGLYVFFKTVSDAYGLIPEDNYTVPPEAEGREPAPEDKDAIKAPLILNKDSKGENDNQKANTEAELVQTESGPSFSNGGSSDAAVNTTKRHRQTPSADLGAILTVLEENEEDDVTSGDKDTVEKEEAPSQLPEESPSKPAEDINHTLPILTEKSEESATKSESEDVKADDESLKVDLPIETKSESIPEIVIAKSHDPVDLTVPPDNGETKHQVTDEKEMVITKSSNNEKDPDEKDPDEKDPDEKDPDEVANSAETVQESASDNEPMAEEPIANASKEKTDIDK